MVKRRALTVLVIGSIAIALLARPLSGVVLIPAVVSAAFAHELAHYIPVKPWDENLYIEVWPLIELKEQEAPDVFAHMGGEISTDTPLFAIKFSTVAPLFFYGWIPIAILYVYGLPVAEQFIPMYRSIVLSPPHFGLMLFLIFAPLISPTDLYHYRNAEMIKGAGSFEMEVWGEE